VTATTVTVTGATCSDPVQNGNVTVTHCTGGVETWLGDITGTGTYSYDRKVNLTTGVRTVTNGVETNRQRLCSWCLRWELVLAVERE
jgi:hypothetical protein